MTARRPLIRYHGGKWKMAFDILPYFPAHRTYVEPYGGGGSILLRKGRSYAEVYNDLDGELVNLFRVVRDDGPKLAALLELTPFARDEYRGSFERSEDPVEQARRTVIRSHMGFGSNALSRKVKSGFRANSSRSGTTPARDWANLPENVRLVVERMRGVVIENKDAAEIMLQHDGPETLHYCDPPYVHSTRAGQIGRSGSGGAVGYTHEMTVQAATRSHSLIVSPVEDDMHKADKRYLIEYNYAGSSWLLEIWADDWQDAERKLHNAKTNARVVGEAVWKSPPWAARLFGWLTRCKRD